MAGRPHVIEHRPITTDSSRTRVGQTLLIYGSDYFDVLRYFDAESDTFLSENFAACNCTCRRSTRRVNIFDPLSVSPTPKWSQNFAASKYFAFSSISCVQVHRCNYGETMQDLKGINYEIRRKLNLMLQITVY